MSGKPPGVTRRRRRITEPLPVPPRYPNLDDSGDLTPSEAHLASSWPLHRGELVNLHADDCHAYDGDECSCRPLPIRGPTGLA